MKCPNCGNEDPEFFFSVQGGIRCEKEVEEGGLELSDGRRVCYEGIPLAKLTIEGATLQMILNEIDNIKTMVLELQQVLINKKTKEIKL